MSRPPRNPSEDDSQLVFTRLFVANERALYGFLLSLVQDHGVVDDLLQELAGRLWKKFDQYDDSRPFVAWGIGFARLLAFEWRRKQQKLPVPMDESTLNALADDAADHAGRYDERRDLLRVCMRELTDRQKQALHARYYEERPVAEIAGLWKRTEMAVYKLLKRAHEALLECMQKAMNSSQEEAGKP
ncbi:MAG: hypothetical protein CMN05_15095 [Roseibacillus sp.]|nr:hypothetical protein [Roseibacillus sp.]MCP4894985.1 sigma-70 family RNA polymerase sigma factor [Actinomycetales bacterium]|tara:strand:+ start:76 stop:636 length:561 start_codon:yes stop_codon:yes gene_type:complete